MNISSRLHLFISKMSTTNESKSSVTVQRNFNVDSVHSTYHWTREFHFWVNETRSKLLLNKMPLSNQNFLHTKHRWNWSHANFCALIIRNVLSFRCCKEIVQNSKLYIGIVNGQSKTSINVAPLKIKFRWIESKLMVSFMEFYTLMRTKCGAQRIRTLYRCGFLCVLITIFQFRHYYVDGKNKIYGEQFATWHKQLRSPFSATHFICGSHEFCSFFEQFLVENNKISQKAAFNYGIFFFFFGVSFSLNELQTSLLR